MKPCFPVFWFKNTCVISNQNISKKIRAINYFDILLFLLPPKSFLRYTKLVHIPFALNLTQSECHFCLQCKGHENRIEIFWQPTIKQLVPLSIYFYAVTPQFQTPVRLFSFVILALLLRRKDAPSPP